MYRGRPGWTKRDRIVVDNEAAVEDGRAEEMAEGEQGKEEVADAISRRRRRREEETHEMQAAEERFRKEQREYQRIEAQRRRETIGREDGIEGLRKQFESWQGICVICYVHSRASEGHQDWRKCPHSDKDRDETVRMWDWLVGVKFRDCWGCRSCWAAQGVCHSWENISHDGRQRFRRKQGEWKRQFRGVIQDAVVAVIALGHSEVVGEWVDGTMVKSGIEKVVGLGGWESRTIRLSTYLLRNAMAAISKLTDLVQKERAEVVDMNECKILLYRKTCGIVTGDLGSCHVFVLQSPIAVLLSHISPRSSLSEGQQVSGDEHVGRKTDEALDLYEKWSSWFPQRSSAWVCTHGTISRLH